MNSASQNRFPKLGKLSVAILEHLTEPIIGSVAQAVLKAPVVEKELLDSLGRILIFTEQRFIKEASDIELRKAILNLPIADIPSIRQSVRAFHGRPTDSSLSEILQNRLGEDFPHLPPDRIASAVSDYLSILRQELVSLSADIREKLNALALQDIQASTAQMVELLKSVHAIEYQEHIETQTTSKKRDENLRRLKEMLGNYLKKIVVDFEQQRLDYSRNPHLNLLDFYIEVKGTKTPFSKGIDASGQVQNLWDMMLPSLKQGHPHLILGDFGIGKTWLSRMILYRLAKEALDTTWIPLWISLKGFRPKSPDMLGLTALSALFTGVDTFNESIFSQIRRQAWIKAIGENATFSLQEELITLYEEGRFLFLLDGLDEIAYGGRDITASITADIGKLGTDMKRSPVFLTCRRSFFTDQAQENNLKLLFNVFYVWPWSHDDINQYLTKANTLGVLKADPQNVLEKLEHIHGLEDVSGRAMVSAMLVDQWDILIKKEVIDLPSLYDQHVHKALLNWQGGKTLRLQEHELRAWMEELAFLMFRLDSHSLTPTDLDQYFSGKFDQFKIERFSQLAESMVRDIKTNSLLVREGGEYAFCHQSIWEYLVAQKLLSALEQDPSAFRVPSRSTQYRSIVQNFLIPMLFQQGKQNLISSLFAKPNPS